MSAIKQVMKKYSFLVFFIFIQSASFAAGGTDSSQNQSFNPYRATEEYINGLPPAARARSDAYFEGGYWLLLWDMVYAVAIAYVFLSLGLSGYIKNKLSRVKRRNLKNALYALIYFLFAWLLIFPLHLYESFIREHQYSLSNQTFWQWLQDDLVTLILNSIAFGIITMLIYIVIVKTAGKWWIWAATISILFLTFIIFISPVLISPLFNDYKPLEEGPLKEKILSMARANSIPADNVYTFNASKQSDRISANVNGLGSTTRISLNDNLLNKCTPAEIYSVVGHEMGHYALNHLTVYLIEMLLVLLILFGFVHVSFTRLLRTRWGKDIEGVQDIGGLPLLMVLISFGFFILTPVTNSITRIQEREADIYGLNAAREPDGEASVDMKLSTYRKIKPGYWEEILFYDHPSGYSRILMAMKWKAENLNIKP
jgi:STE24 endopeptidase